MLKIDFGSGYNLKKDYRSCDFITSPGLDFFYDKNKNMIIDKTGKEIEDESVDVFRIRNVIHHITDIKPLIYYLYKKLKRDGVLFIIDCKEEFYLKNTILDIIWYRFLKNYNEIKIIPYYRDYNKIIKETFNFGSCFLFYNKNEKQASLFYKKKEKYCMEKIIKDLEENGFDYALAFATKEEVEVGAACGQLSIISEF